MSEFGGLWKHEKTQHAFLLVRGVGSATLLQLAFLREKRPGFPMGEIPIGTIKCKKEKKKKKVCVCAQTLLMIMS